MVGIDLLKKYPSKPMEGASRNLYAPPFRTRDVARGTERARNPVHSTHWTLRKPPLPIHKFRSAFCAFWLDRSREESKRNTEIITSSRGEIFRLMASIPPHLYSRIDLDLIFYLHVIVILHPNTAFGSELDLRDIIRIAAQRFEFSLVNDHVIT